LKQDQFVPLPVERQVLILYAAINGYVDDVAVANLKRYETELFRFVENRRPEVFTLVIDKKHIDDQVKAALNAVLDEFKVTFTA
jgi:F-type H+-transporting ATPase subunit alpha